MNVFSQPSPSTREGNGSHFASFAAQPAEFARQAEQRLGDVAEIVKTVVNNRPVAALGAALAAGVFLGWLIKRR